MGQFKDFCRVVGVYAWPHGAADIENVAAEMSGDVTEESLAEAGRQLAALVVIELLFVATPKGNWVAEISQADDEEFGDSTQVPYDESFWSEDGQERREGYDPPGRAPFRLVFFLHEFDRARPLHFRGLGRLELPGVSKLPKRLADELEYLAP